MLNPQNIIEYISKVDGLSHFERFNSSDNIKNELIQILKAEGIKNIQDIVGKSI